MHFFGLSAECAWLVQRRCHPDEEDPWQSQELVTILRETIDVVKLLQRESYGVDGEVIETMSDEERMELLLPELLDVAWAYNFQDISKTLHGACSRLFADASANSQYKRLERAEAIQMMGEEFLLVAASESNRQGTQHDAPPPKDLMVRLEVAFQLSVMKVSSRTSMRVAISSIC
jgi:hypothetical protein